MKSPLLGDEFSWFALHEMPPFYKINACIYTNTNSLPIVFHPSHLKVLFAEKVLLVIIHSRVKGCAHVRLFMSIRIIVPQAEPKGWIWNGLGFRELYTSHILMHVLEAGLGVSSRTPVLCSLCSWSG